MNKYNLLTSSDSSLRKMNIAEALGGVFWYPKINFSSLIVQCYIDSFSEDIGCYILNKSFCNENCCNFILS